MTDQTRISDRLRALTSRSLSRRQFVGYSAATAASVAASRFAPSAAAQDDNTLVVGYFGGTYGDNWQKAVIEPAQEALGIKIVSDNGFTEWYSKVKLNPDNPPIDVFTLQEVDAYRAQQDGILAELDTSGMTNFNNLFDLAKEGAPYRFTIGWTRLGLVINTDKVTTPPTSFADYWKEPLVSMRLGMPGMPNTFCLDFLVKIAELNGGGIDNLDPGFEAVKKLNLAYAAPDFTQAYQDLCAGNLDAMLWVDDQAESWIDKGCAMQYINPSEGAIANLVTLVTAKGSKKQEMAAKFIDFALGVDPQAQFAETQYVGPTNKEVVLDEAVAARCLYGEDQVKSLTHYDPAALLPIFDQVTERWKSEIATG
ncbi:MAG: extracellular solute-binding protein [Thermomicrobiales bacterium]